MVSSYVDVSQYINEKMPEIEDMYERVRYNILQDKLDRKECYDSVYGIRKRTILG